MFPRKIGSLFQIRSLTTSTQYNSLRYRSSAIMSHANTAERGHRRPRNIVLCFDGTDNEFCSSNSNVVKLFSVLQTRTGQTGALEEHQPEQLIYYDSGVGTYLGPATGGWSSLKKNIAIAAERAFAWDFKIHVINGYQYLMDYYRDGDRIFLFGFSRGAYTARALAGMIQKVGLLPPGMHSQMAFAWKVYTEPDEVQKSGRFAKLPGMDATTLAAEYKKTFSRSSDLQVHFIGVWDTVSSIGLTRLPDFPFASGSSNVKHFRQALALDEHRAKFQPEYFHIDPSDGEPASSSQQTTPGLGKEAGSTHNDHSYDELTADHATSVKEVWFRGVHSDIGGHYDLNPDPSASCISLRWMIREAAEAGIHLDEEAIRQAPFYSRMVAQNAAATSAWDIVRDAAHDDTQRPQENLASVPDLEAPLHESLKGWLYNLIEILPLKYYRFNPTTGTRETYRLPLHLWRGRLMRSDQKIHASVLRQVQQYDANGQSQPSPIPKAILPYSDPEKHDELWQALREKYEGLSNQQLAKDPLWEL